MPNTAELLQLSNAHATPNYSPPPFVAARGEGTKLWDTDGKLYLDFASGIGVNILGHAHPAVVQAICDQAHRLCHTANAVHHAPYIEMCTRLARLSFGSRVFLCNSGAEAVEGALKLARRFFFDQKAPRTQFIATTHGFHGRTYGALSVTGQETYQRGFGPLVPDVTFVPYGDITALRAAMTGRTAAVVLEPIQGNGGVVVPPSGYLQAARELCTEHGACLIFDEVQTGIGRTCRWFAHEHEGVIPDILCLAKALGGGLPLGATVTTEALAATFQPGVHATTFGGNPVACAAGLATLDVIEREGLLSRGAELSTRYRAALAKLQARHGAIKEIRGRGMLVGLLMDSPVKDLQGRCRKEGLLTTAAGSHVLRLFPPLNVAEAELESSVEMLDRAIGP